MVLTIASSEVVGSVRDVKDDDTSVLTGLWGERGRLGSGCTLRVAKDMYGKQGGGGKWGRARGGCQGMGVGSGEGQEGSCWGSDCRAEMALLWGGLDLPDGNGSFVRACGLDSPNGSGALGGE